MLVWLLWWRRTGSCFLSASVILLVCELWACYLAQFYLTCFFNFCYVWVLISPYLSCPSFHVLHSAFVSYFLVGFSIEKRKPCFILQCFHFRGTYFSFCCGCIRSSPRAFLNVGQTQVLYILTLVSVTGMFRRWLGLAPPKAYTIL